MHQAFRNPAYAHPLLGSLHLEFDVGCRAILMNAEQCIFKPFGLYEHFQSLSVSEAQGGQQTHAILKLVLLGTNDFD
jgi:hypothetical protein